MSEQKSQIDQAELEFRKQSEAELKEFEDKKKLSQQEDKYKDIKVTGVTIQPQEVITKLSKEINVNTFTDDKAFALAQRVAIMLSQSSIVPKDYIGKDKIGNCMIALDMANRMGISVFTVMQNLDIIYGRPSWRSTYVISAINTLPKFGGQLRFEYSGQEGTDNRACRAYIIDKSGQRIEGPSVSLEMAKREGWYGKNGSKWQTMPELMMSYRAASFFGRLYCPEVLNGLQTVEETIDITPEVVIDSKTESSELE